MLRKEEGEGKREERRGEIPYGYVEDITQWWEVSACDVQHIYPYISIDFSACYVYTGCDCLLYLDHLSQGILYRGTRLWGYGLLEGFRDNLGFLSNQGEGFQIERWSSGELYFNKLGCFATEQPFERDHHTVRLCSKWVL